MNRYRVTLKSGTVFEAENRWIDPSALHHTLCDREPFIKIGDTVFAKDRIAVIQKIDDEKPEEKEEEVF